MARVYTAAIDVEEQPGMLRTEVSATPTHVNKKGWASPDAWRPNGLTCSLVLHTSLHTLHTFQVRNQTGMTQVPVKMSNVPLEAVVLGAGHCIEHYDALKSMFMGARR